VVADLCWDVCGAHEMILPITKLVRFSWDDQIVTLGFSPCNHILTHKSQGEKEVKLGHWNWRRGELDLRPLGETHSKESSQHH